MSLIKLSKIYKLVIAGSKCSLASEVVIFYFKFVNIYNEQFNGVRISCVTDENCFI